jgi:hypothetical protein
MSQSSSRWNDNRKTDAFKSTRTATNTRPTNIRTWTDKESTGFDKFSKKDTTGNVKCKGPPITNRQWNKEPMTTNNRDDRKGPPISNRQWDKEPMTTNNRDDTLAFMKSNNHVEQPIITSKWTAKREKKDDGHDSFSRDNVFSNSYSNNTDRDPEIRSFNKKIVVIERQTIKQMQAEKKAIYDSFIKDSFILKTEDHLSKKETFVAPINDYWKNNDDGDNDLCEHLTDFDKWEIELLRKIDGGADNYETVNKRRKAFFSGMLKPFQNYYELPNQDGASYINLNKEPYYKARHKSILIKELMGLSIFPFIMVQDTQANINTIYESLYEFMISKKMRVVDIGFEYNIENLLKIDDTEIRKQYNKLRKKYNSIQRIQTKLLNKEKILNNEKVKYENRHETVFLYHRLRYYDQYYMNGQFKFVNHVK